MRLGVNIDHIATLRQLRGTPYPNLVEAARVCEDAGADQITIHLREDRRHIQDQDVTDLRKSLRVPMNLEMALSPEITRFALKIVPDWVCLVPEKRQEVTTEGGLDVKRYQKKIGTTIQALHKKGIKVSLFIEPSLAAVKLSKTLEAEAVEFHTGRYCHLTQNSKQTAAVHLKTKKEFDRLQAAVELAQRLGIHAHAGHGIDYQNVHSIIQVRPKIEEVNIGHSIVCRAAMVGLFQAVKEMKEALQ